MSDLPRQFASGEVQRKVAEEFSRGRFVQGPSVEEFEQRFARLCGTPHAIGPNSGTDALFLALRALGIRPGGEVITAPNSFVATDQSRRQQPQDHDLRREPEAPEPAHRGHHGPLRGAAGTGGGDDRRQDLQRGIREPHRRRTGADGPLDGAPRDAVPGADRGHDLTDQRPPFISSEKIARELGWKAQAHDRGRRSGPLPGLPGQQVAERPDRHQVLQREKIQAAPLT